VGVSSVGVDYGNYEVDYLEYHDEPNNVRRLFVLHGLLIALPVHEGKHQVEAAHDQVDQRGTEVHGSIGCPADPKID